MPEETIQDQHCAELACGRQSVYQVFDTLRASTLDADTQEHIRAQLSELVDFILWQDLRINVSVLNEQLQRALSQDFMEPTELIRAWKKAVMAGLPTRGSCMEFLNAFLDYCEILPAELRQAFVRGVSPLSPYVGEWGKPDTAALVATIGAVGTPERIETLLKTIVGYAETDAKIMRAAIQVTARLLKVDRNYVIDILTQEITLDKMMESRDACRLLPALAKAITAADTVDAESGPTVASCVLAIAKINISSACACAVTFGKLASKLPADRFDAYIRHVESLTTQGNIRLLGFCLNELPSLARQHSPKSLSEFIYHATMVSKNYGINAAEKFLRRETPAAKSALAG
ncbi:MAG: hypothetical protein ISS35_05725 [Kiritimatiellae bacterium]|nr:hypothetical protein [Kiritimatiellia bacterium]